MSSMFRQYFVNFLELCYFVVDISGESACCWPQRSIGWRDIGSGLFWRCWACQMLCLDEAWADCGYHARGCSCGDLRFLSWLLILRVSCKLPGLLPNGLGDTSDPCENRPHWSEKTKSAGKSIHMAVAGVRRSTKACNALLIRCIFWRKMMLRTIIHQKLVKVHLLSLISQLFAAESFDFDGSWYGYGSIPINTY